MDAIRTSDAMGDGKLDKETLRRSQIKKFLEPHAFIMNVDVRAICNVSAAMAN